MCRSRFEISTHAQQNKNQNIDKLKLFVEICWFSHIVFLSINTISTLNDQSKFNNHRCLYYRKIVINLINLFFIQESSFISHIVFDLLLEFYLICNDSMNQFYRICSLMNHLASAHLQWFNESISIHLQWFNESISAHLQWFNESTLVYLLCSRFLDCTSLISLALIFESERLDLFSTSTRDLLNIRSTCYSKINWILLLIM